jgi:2-polyprenyl-6-methoxyphenol hydroxylase-like FAD-dependent oxidoreductase
MEIPEQVPVAIVGAGPTGLTLACMLQKAGVDVPHTAALSRTAPEFPRQKAWKHRPG